MSDFAHKPVMLNEVLEYLSPKDGEVYVDGTLGGCGYTKAILESAKCRVIGIDRDPAALAHAKDIHPSLSVVAGCFGDVKDLIDEQVDGFVLDLGVSSVQLDTPERGFSFRFDGPLDMRMNSSGNEETAADIVNEYPEKELADLIYKYGEERKSRHIAASIVKKRREGRIETTFQLADIVRSVVHKHPKDKSDPATRTFQALRIAVNDELGELQRALEASVYILKPGGRLVIVSFHSLEDAIVKEFIKDKTGKNSSGSRYLPEVISEGIQPVFRILTKKAVFANDEEVSENPRSRSARLRAAVRTEHEAEKMGVYKCYSKL